MDLRLVEKTVNDETVDPRLVVDDEKVPLNFETIFREYFNGCMEESISKFQKLR